MKNYYKELEKNRDSYFDKIKADYLFAIKIARKKINAHNIFEQTKLHDAYSKIQRDLGEHSRFLIEIRQAMDLDNRIEEGEEFDKRFNTISSKDREAVIKKLGEFEGMRLMYDYWHRRGAYLNAIENMHSEPVEILTHIEPELAQVFESILEIKQRDFSRGLEIRNTLEEKVSFVQTHITGTRDRIENDLLYKFFNAFNQHPEKIFEIVGYNLKNFENVSLTVFGDLAVQGNAAIEAILKHYTSKPGQDNKEEFNALIKSLKAQGIETSALANTLNTNFENDEHRFLYVPFYFYYEKLFLKFLQTQLEEIKQGSTSKDVKSGEELERNKEFTTHRQVLAVHYLMDALHVHSNADKTNVARFVQFLTSKETGAKRIADTNIYQRLKNPLDKENKNLKADLLFVRGYFEKLNLHSIVEQINRDIDYKE